MNTTGWPVLALATRIHYEDGIKFVYELNRLMKVDYNEKMSKRSLRFKDQECIFHGANKLRRLEKRFSL